ncbi:hypothetical protein DD584_14800 [Klebsiella pneumoniae]|nr:hypothetical protein DD584_14800 [Klebsiella pneumoniae]
MTLVSDCELRGCFQLLHIRRLMRLKVSDCEQGGCFQLLRIRNPLRLKIYDCEQGSYCICGASSEFRGFRDVAANNGMTQVNHREEGRCSAYYHFR